MHELNALSVSIAGHGAGAIVKYARKCGKYCILLPLWMFYDQILLLFLLFQPQFMMTNALVIAWQEPCYFYILQPSCVSVFTKNLKHLLQNVTVHESCRSTLEELKKNLKVLGNQTLGQHQEVSQQNYDCVIAWQTLSSYCLLAASVLCIMVGHNPKPSLFFFQNNHGCSMTPMRGRPFRQYFTFIKHLNNSTKRWRLFSVLCKAAPTH